MQALGDVTARGIAALRRQLGGLSRAVGLERRVKTLDLSLAQGSRAINGVNSQDGVWLVKILSIRQPWAYLITRGSKDIENRSWPTAPRFVPSRDMVREHPAGARGAADVIATATGRSRARPTVVDIEPQRSIDIPHRQYDNLD